MLQPYSSKMPTDTKKAASVPKVKSLVCMTVFIFPNMPVPC